MIIAGLLSTMNVWASKWSDVRWSVNDFYMALLMTGWMFLFMGILDKNFTIILLGLIFIVASFTAIRLQLYVSQKQYLLGMIPHHSMAILMSEKLKEKNNDVESLLNEIITGQEKEIQYMKAKLKQMG
jgi:hypothetical protein